MIFEKAIVGAYQKNICTRYDGNPLVKYFSVADFPGLQRTPFDFEGNAGQKLQGYYYYYSSPRRDRLVIFDHGMGGGHDSYMKEIELIARRGYMVFSYDHTGCKESGGENSIGFIFDGMSKSELFKTVIYDGALPRKTFSMGHAEDKRYYLECRKITK